MDTAGLRVRNLAENKPSVPAGAEGSEGLGGSRAEFLIGASSTWQFWSHPVVTFTNTNSPTVQFIGAGGYRLLLD